MQSTTFHVIPLEIQQIIASNLSYDDILTLCQVDKRLNKICQSEHFWRELLLARYPDIPHPDLPVMEIFRNFEKFTNILVINPEQDKEIIYLAVNDINDVLGAIVGYLLSTTIRSSSEPNKIHDFDRKLLDIPHGLYSYNTWNRREDTNLFIIEPGGKVILEEEWSGLLAQVALPWIPREISSSQGEIYMEITVTNDDGDGIKVKTKDLGDEYSEIIEIIAEYFDKNVEIIRFVP